MTKILVVDDREEYRNLVSNCFLSYFRNNGLEVDVAMNVNEGLEYFTKKGPYALISSDCKMPGFDNEMSGEAGLEMISRIKDVQYQKFGNNVELYVPIIFVTGSSISREKIDYPDIQVLGVIEKFKDLKKHERETFWKIYKLIVDSGLESAIDEYEFAN
jgi:CheY-like chemotaxis protein